MDKNLTYVPRLDFAFIIIFYIPVNRRAFSVFQQEFIILTKLIQGKFPFKSSILLKHVFWKLV